jgi:sugar phosphate permease
MNRRWIVLSLVFFGIVISYVDRGNLSIAAPSIMRDFRIAPATMGFLLSASWTGWASAGLTRVVSLSGH